MDFLPMECVENFFRQVSQRTDHVCFQSELDTLRPFVHVVAARERTVSEDESQTRQTQNSIESIDHPMPLHSVRLTCPDWDLHKGFSSS